MRAKALVSFVICSAIILCSVAQLALTAEQTGRFPPSNGCLCPSEILRFECTIKGGGITVWSGTLLACPPTNDISISHHNFRESEDEKRSIVVRCNHDSVTASLCYWRLVNSNHYYSQVNVSRELNSNSLNGSTVTCAHDDGSNVTMVSTWTIIDPLSSPVNVHLEQANKTHLTFSWDPQFTSCPSLRYDIHTTHCGSCPNSVNSATFICENVGVTTDMRACSVAVQARCGNVVGNLSDIIQVMLKVPDVPLVEILPSYSFSNKEMLKLNVTINEVAQVPLFSASGIPDATTLNYTIIYSDTMSNMTCDSTIIECQHGACSHVFEVSNSSCKHVDTIAVTSYATNMFGDGHQTESFIGHANKSVDIKFDLIKKTTTCVFLNDPTSGLKLCKANITHGINCENEFGLYETAGFGDSVTVELWNLTDGTSYCFNVFAKNGLTAIVVQGRFEIPKDYQDTVALAFGIGVVAVITAIVGLSSVTVVLYCYSRRQSATLQSYCIEFCVKDQPGSIKTALKVFDNLGINITFVDTVQSHPGPLQCFRVSYDHSRVKIREVINELEKIVEEVQEVPHSQQRQQITRIVIRFSVRDKKGTLLRVLTVLEDLGINIIHLRGGDHSSAGVQEYTFEGECPNHSKRVLLDELKRKGAINPKIDDEVIAPLQFTDSASDCVIIEFTITENRVQDFHQTIEAISTCQNFQQNTCKLTFVKMSTDENGRLRGCLVCVCPKAVSEGLIEEIKGNIKFLQEITIRRPVKTTESCEV